MSLGPQSPSGKMGVLALSSGHGLKTVRLSTYCLSHPALTLHTNKLIQSLQLPFEFAISSPTLQMRKLRPREVK